MKSQPRYRKLEPEHERSFSSPEEREMFLRNQIAVSNNNFSVLKKLLPDWGTTSSFTTEQTKMIHQLIDKCNKFCPHITTTAMPTFSFFAIPSINSAFCEHCGPDFLALAVETSDNKCDLCEQENKNFVEFGITIGYGMFSFNLGTLCCAGKMNNQTYTE